MSITRLLKKYREEFKERYNRHKRWYYLWVLVNINSVILFILAGLDAVLVRRGLALINMVMVFLDEYIVTRHGTTIKDLLGSPDEETGSKWGLTHEFIALILFLLAII